jgi:hypothetical protein
VAAFSATSRPRNARLLRNALTVGSCPPLVHSGRAPVEEFHQRAQLFGAGAKSGA